MFNTQELLEKLIENFLQVPADKKQSLMSFYNRLLATNFSEEPESLKTLESKIVNFSDKKKDQIISSYTHLMNKKGIIQKEKAIKLLLKISEFNNELSESTNASFNFLNRSINTKNEFNSNHKPYDNFSLIISNNLVTNRALDHTKIDGRKSSLRLFECLISTFQAIQSEMFVYDNKVEMFVLRPKFEDTLPLSLVGVILQLNEIGWLFYKIDDTIFSLKKKISGLTIQSLLSAVQEEIREFYEFLNRMNHIERVLDSSTHNFLTVIYSNTTEQFNKLRTIAIILEYASHLNSSETLSLLFIMSKKGFLIGQSYLVNLFESSSRILMEFINNWVISGNLIDSMSEFFIKINLSSTDSDKYWREGLVFVDSKIPNFIEYNTAMSIFNAGKVVRLLKKMSINFIQTQFKPIQLQEIIFNNSNFGLRNRFNEIFENHNQILMKYIHETLKLKEVLLFLRDFYLTHRGDFCFQFIEELDKTVHINNLSNAPFHLLYNCMDSAMKITFENRKEFTKDAEIRTFEKTNTISTVLKDDYYDFFVNFYIEIKPFKMPVNNVISSDILAKYQTVFRYIFTLKIARYKLREFWSELSRRKTEKTEEVKMLSKMCSNLLNKMIKLIDGLLSYWIFDIVEKYWKVMFEESIQCHDFPNLINCQAKFIDKVIEEITFKQIGKVSELANKYKEIYDRSIHNILSLINLFYFCKDEIFIQIADVLERAEMNSYDSMERLENKNYDMLMKKGEGAVQKVRGNIIHIDKKFCENALQILDLLKGKSTQNKLDFNEWYASYRSGMSRF